MQRFILIVVLIVGLVVGGALQPPCACAEPNLDQPSAPSEPVGGGSCCCESACSAEEEPPTGDACASGSCDCDGCRCGAPREEAPQSESPTPSGGVDVSYSFVTCVPAAEIPRSAKGRPASNFHATLTERVPPGLWFSVWLN